LQYYLSAKKLIDINDTTAKLTKNAIVIYKPYLLTIDTVYTPTKDAAEDVKDQIYQELRNCVFDDLSMISS